MYLPRRPPVLKHPVAGDEKASMPSYDDWARPGHSLFWREDGAEDVMAFDCLIVCIREIEACKAVSTVASSGHVSVW